MEPGLSFDNTVLSVRTNSFRMRIRWVDDPHAEQETPGVGWRTCFPDFCVLPEKEDSAPNPFAMRLKEANDGFLELERFRDTIRPDVVNIVEPFCSHQWNLLKLLYTFPRTLDWACVNPVMAYCLANNSEFRAVPGDIGAIQAVWYSYRKQKVILKWLGFPGTEAVVRLMRKIDPAEASPAILRRLRNILVGDKELLDMLSHQKRLTFGMLNLVTNRKARAVLTPNLLKSVLEEQGNGAGIDATDQLMWALHGLDRFDPHRRIPRLQTIQQITNFSQSVRDEVHIARERERLRRERYAEEELARKRRRRAPWEARFPPPPVPGTRLIRPIESYRELLREGKQQSNCVSSYWSSVVRGNLYIYRVLQPQRATLSIRFARGRWYISELEACNNRKANKSTRAYISTWLAQAQGGKYKQ